MLARLGVRAVVMGEYCLNEIQFRNRQESNKIYSLNGTDRAVGFIPNTDFKIMRRLEPYYAPIGWRRLAINIGLTKMIKWL